MTKMRTQYFIFHIFVLGIFFIIADYVSALAKPAQLIDIRSHYHYEDQKTRIVLEFNQKVDYDNNVDSDQITLQIPDSSKFRTATKWKPEIPPKKTLEDLLNYHRERVMRKEGPRN